MLSSPSLSNLPSVFELTEVSYRFQDNQALEQVTLRVNTGQRIALLGANGSGKSTLLRLLDGLYLPSTGKLKVFGQPLNEKMLQDVSKANAFRRRVGLVFQNPDVQLFNPTVFDELAFGPLQLGWPPERLTERIEAMLATFSLGHLRDRAPHRLSGGEKKRVALASVLILSPEVLLLDEPCSGLDPVSQDDMIDFLRHCRDRTVITATHDLEVVPEIADYCLVMQQGRLAAQGTPEAILTDSALLRQCRLRR